MRQPAFFTVFTIDLKLPCSEKGVDVLQNVLYSINFFLGTIIKFMMAKY